MMPASCRREWAETAESAFDRLATGGKPVAVIGVFDGGDVGATAGEAQARGAVGVDGAFLAIRFSGLIPLRPATYLRGLAEVRSNLPPRPSAVRDPVMRRWAAGSSMFRTFSLQATLSALELIDEVTPMVPEVRVPALVIQGQLDTAGEAFNAVWLHQRLGSLPKELLKMNKSGHLVALDRERDQVIAATLNFLASRVLREASL